MKRSWLIRADESRLVVVDVQQRLVPVIHDAERVVVSIAWLVGIAARVDIPVAAVEQYPQGLGPTVEPLRSLIPATAIAAKRTFSCAEDGCLDALPGAQSREMAAFEWLHHAGDNRFRAVHRAFLR